MRVWLRITGVGLLAAGLLYGAGDPIAQRLLPLFRLAAQVVALDFSVKQLEVVQQPQGRVLLAHANLAAPVLLGGRWAQPFGLPGQPDAEYRVTVSVAGLFANAVLYLTLVLAWPASVREWLVRLALSGPALALLLLLDAPFTIAAELWNLLYEAHLPGEVSKLMVFSRLLMNGGGLVVAGALSVVVVTLARHAVRRGAGQDDTALPPAEEARHWNARRRSARAMRA